MVVGNANTQINHHYGGTRRPSRWGRLAAVALLLLAAGSGAIWWELRDDDAPGQAVGAADPLTPPSRDSDDTSTAPAATWYDLAGLRPIATNNGFYFVDPVRIGTETYPASIIGNQPSSTSAPLNKGIWPLGGSCTEFSVSVGKRMDSAGAGIGRFVINGDDRELLSVERGPNDPAMPVTVDVTGVLRLTLLDVRESQDAVNAWGRPRLLCTSAPGPAR